MFFFFPETHKVLKKSAKEGNWTADTLTETIIAIMITKEPAMSEEKVRAVIFHNLRNRIAYTGTEYI